LERDIKIAIIGLGYVGLPLALAFSKKYAVVGYDINTSRVANLNKGIDITQEADELELVNNPNLQITSDQATLEDCSIYIVTVPTPIDKYKSPDLGPLLEASKLVGSVLKEGDIVIYESTVYPGCTEEDCVPVLEKYSGLQFNTHFYCGYSPERINPGDKINTLTKIKKITSGSTSQIANVVNDLYGSIIEAGTYLAPSIKVAEAAKAIENAQRDINISFVNELALIFDKIGIDTNDVLEAASTKWNFLPFKPGLVGGHCIGVDPYYLAHKAQMLGYHPQVILSGRQVNDNMGVFIANKLVKLMIAKGNVIKGANVLVMGIAFKENCPDIRNSKVFDIITELQEFGMQVDVYDPIADVSQLNTNQKVNLIESLAKTYDGIVVAVAHSSFLTVNIETLKSSSSAVIVDIKGCYPRHIVDSRL
jgi:UDP-N-acetyl-D-glucosamine/UDP-N-acetyl-D-galactosamine dehydrogenase